MGVKCCRPSGAFNPESKKILQLRKCKQSNEEDTSSGTPLLIVDIEEERIFRSKVSLRIVSSIKGMSQLNIDNSLYLCGSEIDSPLGAYMINIDNTKSTNSVVNFLVNAQYPHVYPSMINVPSNSILVVGGKQQIKCEKFDITNSKWKYIPELPEERYKCNLFIDHNNKYVYLFGGYCSEIGQNRNDILRIKLDTLMIWDRIKLKGGDKLLEKTSCGIIRDISNEEEKKSKVVYILGGKDNQKELCDSIVEFDLKKREARTLKNKLKYKAKFINQIGVNVDKNTYVLIDKKGNIHTLNFNDFSLYTDEEEETS